MQSPTSRQQEIMHIVASEEPVSISAIRSRIGETISIPTLNRELAGLVTLNWLVKIGKGRATAYKVSSYYRLMAPIAVTGYFDKNPDARDAKTGFNHSLFDVLESVPLLTEREREELEALSNKYRENVSSLSPALYKKEMERLTIELSWKSSQIEGNTYSLLETERLFMEKIEAADKPREEAIMLLNHKEALHYLLQNKEIGQTLTLRALEEIHSILTKELGVSRNLRARSVGITGTAYRPLDNEHQIRENVERMCTLVNSRNNAFEKALLAVILISYIQPFEDGNKRTGRMLSNAVLIAYNHCPLSYRSVEVLDYKKAVLLFYEQNNLEAFKDIFIEQYRFAVRNYFL